MHIGKSWKGVKREFAGAAKQGPAIFFAPILGAVKAVSELSNVQKEEPFSPPCKGREKT